MNYKPRFSIFFCCFFLLDSFLSLLFPTYTFAPAITSGECSEASWDPDIDNKAVWDLMDYSLVGCATNAASRRAEKKWRGCLL